MPGVNNMHIIYSGTIYLYSRDVLIVTFDILYSFHFHTFWFKNDYCLLCKRLGNGWLILI